jgi:23S rRNA (adenine2503-C2)-methyltransferase
LIEYNSHGKADFKPSPKKVMKDFAWIAEDRGFEVNIRYKRGREILAACGQLGANAV